MTFARATLSGTVASQPEKRFTQNNTAVTSFMLEITPPPRGNAPSNPYQVKITCWARLAETVAETVQHGQTVLVEGRLQAVTETTPDGTNKKSFEIEAGQVSIVTGQLQDVVAAAAMGGNTAAPAPAQPQQAAQPQMAMAGNAPAPAASAQPAFTEDDIPF